MLYRLYEKTEYMIKSASHPHIVLPLNDVTSSIGKCELRLLYMLKIDAACTARLRFDLGNCALGVSSFWGGVRADAHHDALWERASVLRVRPRCTVREVVWECTSGPRAW